MEKHLWEGGEKKLREKIMSAVLLLLLEPLLEKREREKETDWVCLEKSCISQRGVLHTSADLWIKHDTS